MFLLATVLACALMVAMLASVRIQKRLRSDKDLFGLTWLILPVDCDRVDQLFDPAEEWSLRVKNRREVFKLIQRNRRKVAIQYAFHMFRNANILQRIGYAGKYQYERTERVIKGQMLVDAGVPVRLRAALLVLFLRFQQVAYASSNLSCLRDIVRDLLPDWDNLIYAASSLSESIDPKLHRQLMGLLAPSSGRACS